MDTGSRRVQSILQRVEDDLQRGDYKLAETRLSDYLRTKGYNPDLLARLGRIAHDMRDPCAAGKYWLVSNAEGAEVDASIDALVQRCGRNPRQLVSSVPRYARLKKFDDYPAIVRNRLIALDVGEIIVRKAHEDARAGAATGFWGNLKSWLMILLFFAALLGGCVGFHRALHMITGP